MVSEKTMIKVSFHLIVQDEEVMIHQHIMFLLKLAESIKHPVEFVIVDGGSKDKTLEIVGSLKDERFKIYENPWPGFSEQRNFVKSKSEGEWMFMIDADVTISDSIYTKINELLDVNNDIIAYSFPKIHLFGGIENMYNKSLDPMMSLFRNLPEISWKGDGLEAPYFGDKVIIQHPAHFNFPWQKYIRDVVMIHFAELKSFEQKVQKCLRYSGIERSRWFNMSEGTIREVLSTSTFNLNPVIPVDQRCDDLIIPISERFAGLKFYSEFN